MANKKTNKKEIENDEIPVSKTLLSILLVIIFVLFIVSIIKAGIFGLYIHNFFSYIFSNIYYIPVFFLFVYLIYLCFFKENKRIKSTILISLILLNLCLMMFVSILNNNINTFDEFNLFLSDGIKNLGNDLFDFSGGIIGNFLYVLFNSMIDRIGSIIMLIVLFLLGIALIIPKETYKNYNELLKEKAIERKAIKEEERKRREIEEILRKEEARLNKNKIIADEEDEDELYDDEEINTRTYNPERKALIDKILNFFSIEIYEEYEDDDEQEYEEVEEDNYEDEYIEDEEDIEEIEEEVINEHPDIFIDDDKYHEFRSETIKEEEVDNLQLVDKEEKEPKEKESKSLRINTEVVRNKRGVYHYPTTDELEEPSKQNNQENEASAIIKGDRLIEVLNTFGIEAELTKTHIVPTVTKFEIKPDSSVKVDRIQNISNNIKMELAVKDIRIEAPIPGRSAVGIEIPNKIATAVKMKDLMDKKKFPKNATPLTFALGKDLLNENVYCDLSKMPHMLIAGATGSGKSVCINTVICSFLFKCDPNQVKLILIDPKKVEFTPYHDIPHLLWPVITDTQMACNALKKATVIMEDRYDLFSSVGVRNIASYNDYVDEYNSKVTNKEEKMSKLPYIVIIIDELADLMMMAKKDVQSSIQRITQLARACGIHLIIATQRPSVDVITGIIKSNIPSRISFAVTSVIDSRTILDRAGAERLLGNGDMLYQPQGDPAPTRIQGCFISDNEVRYITTYVKTQADPAYDDTYYELLNNQSQYGDGDSDMPNKGEADALYEEVLAYVVDAQKASTSLLQRRFGIGYNRAARLIDMLEDRGIIGPAQGSKPREVYRKKESLEE